MRIKISIVPLLYVGIHCIITMTIRTDRPEFRQHNKPLRAREYTTVIWDVCLNVVPLTLKSVHLVSRFVAKRSHLCVGFGINDFNRAPTIISGTKNPPSYS